MALDITMSIGAEAEMHSRAPRGAGKRNPSRTEPWLTFYGFAQEVHNKGAEGTEKCASQEIARLAGSRSDDAPMSSSILPKLLGFALAFGKACATIRAVTQELFSSTIDIRSIYSLPQSRPQARPRRSAPISSRTGRDASVTCHTAGSNRGL